MLSQFRQHLNRAPTLALVKLARRCTAKVCLLRQTLAGRLQTCPLWSADHWSFMMGSRRSSLHLAPEAQFGNQRNGRISGCNCNWWLSSCSTTVRHSGIYKKKKNQKLYTSNGSSAIVQSLWELCNVKSNTVTLTENFFSADEFVIF